MSVLRVNIADLHADARTLTVDEFAKLHGDAFLLGSKSALRAPKRLEQTRSGPASPAPGPGQSGEISFMIIPIRKRNRSLSVNKISVGRTANNDVVIEDASVSKLHAFFSDSEAGLALRDAGSSTGTKINGAIVPKLPIDLTSGDEVQFGAVIFSFLSVEALIEFVKKMAPRQR